MESYRELGNVDRSNIQHLRNLKFSNIVKSSYAPQRLEVWYGYASNLQSIKDNRVEVKWVEDFPDWIENLRREFFPASDSCLICKGAKPDSDTSIDWHRDHGTFENRVVMANFGGAYFYLNEYGEGVKTIPLSDGQVVDFDSKLLHKSSQVSDERYIITFRKVKREFLKYKLF